MGSDNLTKRISGGSARQASLISLAAFLFGTILVATPALADEVPLIDFIPLPASPYVHEMIWNGSELYEGPGAVGTGFGTGGAGDGHLSASSQFAPGLLVQSPFLITGIPGGVTNTVSVPNSTAFYDATLDIIPVGSPVFSGGSSVMGIPRSGGAVVTDLGGGIKIILQPLGLAEFKVWSTDPPETPDVENPVLLLAGTINTATITAFQGSTTGAVLSADVTYTSGAILTAAGLGHVDGTFSWSLLNATPKFGVAGGFLAPFEANATGQFSAVPEPGTFVLLVIGAAALGGYVWRKRRTLAFVNAA